MKIYTIHDRVAKCYLPLFLARNDDEATRMWIVSLPEMFRLQDYSLYSIGTFDDEHGEISGFVKELVAHGDAVEVDSIRRAVQ